LVFLKLFIDFSRKTNISNTKVATGLPHLSAGRGPGPRRVPSQMPPPFGRNGPPTPFGREGPRAQKGKRK